MKKKLYPLITIVLLVLCAVLSVQVIFSALLHKEKVTDFVESTAAHAEGIVLNLDPIFEDPENPTTIGAVRIELSMLNDLCNVTNYAFAYNILWQRHNFLGGADIGYIPFLLDDFEQICTRYEETGRLSADDVAELKEMRNAFADLLAVLQNDDGTLNSQASNSEYFAAHFNRFVDAVK